MFLARPTTTMFIVAALFWSCACFASPFLLPSQEKPNFFNRRMCRDHDVLSGILTAALQSLQTKVTVAGSDGKKRPYNPDDVHLEAVSVLGDGMGAIICSVTISAKGITERVAYAVGPEGAPGAYGNSWVIKFGGDLGPGGGGGHKLFPEMIQVRRPRPSEVPPQ